MAVKEIPTYQYRKYEFGGNIEEFQVNVVSDNITIESDDFKLVMDFDSFQELKEKLNRVYEELR